MSKLGEIHVVIAQAIVDVWYNDVAFDPLGLAWN
jgi:hypothetical protein